MNTAAIYGTVTTVISDSVPAGLNISTYWYPLATLKKGIDFMTTKELITLYNKAVTEFDRIKANGVVYAYTVSIDRSQMSSMFKIYEVHRWNVATDAQRTKYITDLFDDLNTLVDSLSYFGIIADGKTLLDFSQFDFDNKGMVIVTDPATGEQTSTVPIAQQGGSKKMIVIAGGLILLFLLYKYT